MLVTCVLAASCGIDSSLNASISVTGTVTDEHGCRPLYSFVVWTSEGSGDYYCYCRIGDRYGKWRVVQPSFGHADDGLEVVMAHIELRLNLDGSRNVETAR